MKRISLSVEWWIIFISILSYKNRKSKFQMRDSSSFVFREKKSFIDVIRPHFSHKYTFCHFFLVFFFSWSFGRRGFKRTCLVFSIFYFSFLPFIRRVNIDAVEFYRKYDVRGQNFEIVYLCKICPKLSFVRKKNDL